MKFRDTFSLAYRTVRGNKLRTGLTVAIIAFGIMALVGIRTAIAAMEQKFVESFSSMGATGFTVRYKEPRFRFGGQELKKEKKGEKKEKKSNIGKPITRQQAEAFKANFNFPAQVSLTMFGSNNAVISHGGKKSNPTTRIYGGDENWVDQNGFSIAYGRNLNTLDIQTARNVCLIGTDVARKFFGDDLERPLDQVIKINNIPFRVVGTLNPKGSTLGMSWDNAVITSYNNVRRFFNSNPNASFNIQVKVADIKLMDAATGQATATFRPIRKLTTTEDDNFAIDKSDSFAEMLIGLLSSLTGAALIIGFITLLGAAIGLTNIMLVAVTERTKEIGLAKAIGGKEANIKWQFLFESTIISLFGAFFGIILGVMVGNLFSMYLNTGFVIPWFWTITGIIICTLVGLLAGLYPAQKASRLNPIEALRYE
ncbi:ABC transporter permease [Pseudoflavitalea rhizosphaerae]|uniref:ABC transporter permease n=1 Tax=Pseudoflavitalea rhizosphaerae TaxID=1884793 RepID=UPI000F8C82BC|nr:ABC transporter permease [Pseudoflavitalea rhizosphaerae]